MARATGIQITETAIRVVELDGTPKKHKILGASIVPILPGEEVRPLPDEIGAATRTALKEIKAKREFLVLGIPAREATIREIVVPFTDADQIRKVIKFESEAHLPTSNIDDVIIGWYKISETGPRSRLLIFAVEKATLRYYLDALGRVGIEPSQVDLDCTALYAWSRLQPEFADAEDDPRAHVILDLGESSSTVMIVRGDSLRLVRNIRLGSDSLMRTLTHDLEVGPDEARRITHELLSGSTLPFASTGDAEAGDPATALTASDLQGDIVRDRHDAFARRIVNEVRRSVASIQLEGGVGGIWLTGPASSSGRIEQALRDAFEVDVKALDPLANAENSLPSESGLWVPAAAGLALKSFEHDPIGLEFRQEEFTFARKFERVRMPLLILAMASLMVFGFLCIAKFGDIKDTQNRTKYNDLLGDQVFENYIVKPAARKTAFSIMGFDDPEGARDELDRIKRKPDGERNKAYYTFLVNGPVEHMKTVYGILFDEGDSETPPERSTTSALVRMDQFLGAFNNVKDKLEPFTIESWDVSTLGVSWKMKSGRSDAFTLLKAEFEKIPGYDHARPAAPGPVKVEGEFNVYSSCKLHFEREGT